MLLVSGGYLVTIVVAVLFGDLIAGEASRSTLKYLLAIPVPRLRLLGVKAAGGRRSILLAGLVGMAAIALLVGVLSYGPGGMQVPNGPRLDLGETLGRLALTTAVTPFGLLWAAALGLLLTVLTDSPLAAAGGVVVVAIVSTHARPGRGAEGLPALAADPLRVRVPAVPAAADRSAPGRGRARQRPALGPRARPARRVVVPPEGHHRLTRGRPRFVRGSPDRRRHVGRPSVGHMRLIVIAKECVPGRVKTRLTPLLTPVEAAALASVSLEQTLETVRQVDVAERVLLLQGDPRGLDTTGFRVEAQVRGTLDERIAAVVRDRSGDRCC